MIGNTHNGFKPLANIITERLNNTQKINLNIISGKRVKKSIKKRLHKIKQTNNWPVIKQAIIVEDKLKRYSIV